MISLKSAGGRSAMTLLSVTIIVMALFSDGCATSQKPPNPQKTMSLTIDSVPSGADVYTYRNGQRGTLIGTTPLEIEVGAHFAYYGPKYQVWFYSPDDCVTAERIDAEAGEEYKLYLNCVLLKEGYAPMDVSGYFFTLCSVHFEINFQDENVELSFPLDPVSK